MLEQLAYLELGGCTVPRAIPILRKKLLWLFSVAPTHLLSCCTSLSLLPATLAWLNFEMKYLSSGPALGLFVEYMADRIFGVEGNHLIGFWHS